MAAVDNVEYKVRDLIVKHFVKGACDELAGTINSRGRV